jgi:hypothetical protein
VPSSDLEILAAYECPRGGLCSCTHPGGDEWACPHCGCDCSLPDQFDAIGDPDACPCCHRTPDNL